MRFSIHHVEPQWNIPPRAGEDLGHVVARAQAEVFESKFQRKRRRPPDPCADYLQCHTSPPAASWTVRLSSRLLRTTRKQAITINGSSHYCQRHRMSLFIAPPPRNTCLAAAN